MKTINITWYIFTKEPYSAENRSAESDLGRMDVGLNDPLGRIC